MRELLSRSPCLDVMDRSIQVIMNKTAAPVVNLVMKELPPEPPKRVCEAPPNAAPISAPLPDWSKTMTTSATQAIT
jgi:hypothetical protein